MAPIKFEEQLKEKLEKRTIQPPPEAWNALANRLDQHDKTKTTRSFWWLGIAASIVGIILVTTFVFDGSESNTVSPTVVDVETNEDLNSNGNTSKDIIVSQQETVAETNTETPISKEEQTVPKVEKPLEIISPKEPIILNEAVASNDLKEQEQIQNENETVINNSDYEVEKLNAVVAEINRLQTENQGVSEAEIDSLLKQAEREILTNKLNNLNTRTVDANSLLQDVKADLEQSFRTRVFEALLNNYETVKTAVAERNN